MIILGVAILPELLQRRNSTPITPAPGCPPTYYLYSTECGRFCYRYESSNCKSWTSSRTVCREEGGDLLVPSECYYKFFKDNAQQNEGSCPTQFWLGGSTTSPGTNFISVGGAPISNTFSFWRSGQPDGGGGTENCLEMRKSYSYLMNDVLCKTIQGFICQILL
ncbi:hypothetical protein CHS0354_003777 [Potamilus streckersoni]|uniref:C-type lectin domain-containing protein n=1 Tax=Potamilus streckersoni TaxID=2493646 RepID=A0AAE0T2B4_9BIVA|nr:hypothetical protein CHS0354_003777 [Potamilus streckersoni]